MLPVAVSEGVTAYVQAVHMSDAERAEASANYAAALKAIGYDPNADLTGKDPSGSEAANKHIGQQRLATQEMIWDGLGKGSSIKIDVLDTITGSFAVPSGQVVENFEVITGFHSWLDTSCLAAYTTRETVFTDAQGNQVTTAADARNILTIRRLYLDILDRNRTLSNEWYNTRTLLRTLYDYEDNTTLQDGVYADGKLTPYNDPYFANLQFLHAALGDALHGEEETFTLQSEADPEDFLLFEMNGRTYVIRQESLRSIVDSQKGTIIPFFAVDEEQRGTPEAGVTSATGRTEVTIGADGAGGLAAVYVATVPNTTNNALYMSKYDPNTGTWGKGVILAMNHMDVYEDAVEEGWEPEEAEQAYLGRRAGYGKGGMDQFHFLNPQIALGVKGGSDAVADSVDSANPTENSGSRTTLLVLTQGNMSYLASQEIPDGDGGKVSVLVPDPEGRGKYPRGTGIYAISYGMGHQSLGEAGLSFSNDDFTAGANLYACLSFKNTGDVSIRKYRRREHPRLQGPRSGHHRQPGRPRRRRTGHPAGELDRHGEHRTGPEGLAGRRFYPARDLAEGRAFQPDRQRGQLLRGLRRNPLHGGPGRASDHRAEAGTGLRGCHRHALRPVRGQPDAGPVWKRGAGCGLPGGQPGQRERRKRVRPVQL